jgi:hypothetical protein
MPSPGWVNPINVPVGQTQTGVDPLMLLPSRSELLRGRLAFQRQLIQSGVARHTPIHVNSDGVIFDGHHAVRAAAEEGRMIDVKVIDFPLPATADSIMDLPLV